MAGESKKAEEKFVKSIRLTSELRKEIISKLPRALEDRAVAKEISGIFLKLGRLDEEEQEQAKIIRAALEEAYFDPTLPKSPDLKGWSQKKINLVSNTHYCLRKIFNACESGKYNKDEEIWLIPEYPPECYQDYVELSIKHYCDVNATDSDKWTRLHYMAAGGYVELAAFLIQHKADINARNKKGLTPLDLALRNRHNLVCELLRKYGANYGSELDKQEKKEAQTPSPLVRSVSKRMEEVSASLQLADSPKKENSDKAVGTTPEDGQEAADPSSISPSN